jgi:hypothetical protein
MPKTYEHTFADLHGNDDGPAASVVDLGPDSSAAADATGARINPAPGNPDKGKADQFGDINPAPAADVDDGIDLDLEGGDADAEQVDAEQGGDEDDLRGYSKNVRERIQRERRMREEAEERSRRTEAELANISRKVDLQGKETEWSQADEKTDAALAKLKADKVAAMEAGETANVVDLDDKITDLKAEKRQRDAERKQAREAAKAAPAAPAVATNPKAKAWIDKHPAYNTDPLFKKAANAADQLLYAKGMNAQSDDYYVELTRILADKFDVDKTYLQRGKNRGGSPRGGGSQGIRQGNQGQVRKGDNGRVSVTITKEDKALLAQMGQDVDDPAVLRQYAREKVALQRAEQQQRGER